MNSKLTSRAALVVITALFVLPLLLAWLMWNGTIDIKPATSRNLGELVQPPVAVEPDKHFRLAIPSTTSATGNAAALFDGHWVILHVIPEPCSSACLAVVTGIRQVYKATGRNQSRIKVALMLEKGYSAHTVDDLNQIYPGFLLVQAPGVETTQVLKEIAAGFSAPIGGNSYLIDPIGNIMMFYAAGSDPNDLKKDLKRLLTWSKLDK